MERAKSPLLAATLTLVVIGLGQIYAGRVARGFAVLTTSLPVVVAVLLGLWVIVPIWYLLVMHDAYQCADSVGVCPSCRKTIHRQATACPYCTRSTLVTG